MAEMPCRLAKINGILVWGLLSSALRQVVTRADAKNRSHASRTAAPQPKGALAVPSSPAASAVSNSAAHPASEVFKLSQDSRRDASSCWSVGPKYGVNDATVTLGG